MVSGERLSYAPGRIEHHGRVLGLTGGQLAVVAAALGPVLLLFGSGDRITAAMLVPLAALVIGLAVVPIRGRVAARWLLDLTLHAYGSASGASSFQSRAAAGLPVWGHGPDLPGPLGALEHVEVPATYPLGRVCVLHDPAEGRWLATARLTARGVGLASARDCTAMADGLRELLRGLVAADRLDRVSLYVRAVPDDGTEHRLWADRHAVADPPALVAAATAELRELAGSVAVRQDCFLTVSAPSDALRRAAREAGGGRQGYATALHRCLAALSDPVQAMGCDAPAWLGAEEMSEALRTGYNPAAAARLTLSRLTDLTTPTAEPHTTEAGAGPAPSRGLPWELAGPSRAPSPQPRSWAHDGYLTAAYTAVPTASGVGFGAVAPLLAIRHAGERRAVAVHLETVPRRAATRMATRERLGAQLLGQMKTEKGFGTSAVDVREVGSAHRVEHALAAGEDLVRVAVAVAVTVPHDWNLETHAEAFENSCPSQFQLHRLDLAQDSGFVAAVQPVGIGLTPLRSRM